MARRGEPDWAAIKQDYCSCTDALRKIAARHGIAHSTLQRKAKAEGWAADRADYASTVLTKTAEAQGAALGEGVRHCVRVAEKLLTRLERRVEDEADLILDKDLRAVAGALKDIRDILVSDLDVEKRRAELENLRRSLGGETGSAGGVVLMPAILEDSDGEA